MDEHGRPGLDDRRRFLRLLGWLGVGAQSLLRPARARATDLGGRTPESLPALPPMPRRRLGRTGFEASRLVFGCGAALARRPNDALLETALEAGVNVFDVGYRGYYRDAEQNLGPFVRRVRERVFLISKARLELDVEPDEEVPAARAREAAAGWQRSMDQSLRELGVERLDAYYVMAAYNPSLVASDEIQEAFRKARDAGTVRFLGLSTHRNAQRVLEAAIAAGSYDLAMIAITPGGWYDWKNKSLLEGSPPMVRLRPLLDRAREAGIGLVGMKAGRYLAGRKFMGWGSPGAFDDFYDEAFLRSQLSPFQRSYAFVLGHGLDVVNADMQSLEHLRENFVAAATSHRYFA